MSSAKELFHLTRSTPKAAQIFIVIFVLWGLGGFFLVFAEVMSAASLRNSPQGVGIGTSSYVTMEILFWIGGMFLFGIASLICGSNFSLHKTDEATGPSTIANTKQATRDDE